MTTKKMTARELKRFYADSTFKKTYIYDGHDLGAACGSDGTVFKLWSPVGTRAAVFAPSPWNGERKAYGCTEQKKIFMARITITM